MQLSDDALIERLAQVIERHRPQPLINKLSNLLTASSLTSERPHAEAKNQAPPSPRGRR
jgi:hypothetical protein